MSTLPSLSRLSLLAAELRGSNLRSRSPEEIHERLKELLEQYSFIGVNYTHETVFCRGRICPSSEGFSNLSDLIYPTPPKPQYGRANLPGGQTLYAAVNKNIVLDEIGAMAGDYVQVIGVRVRSDKTLPIVLIGEYQSVLNSGRSLLE